MNLHEILIIGCIAYFTTGIALTGYDFSAPPIHKKMYVTQQNYKIAFLNFFIWPIASITEGLQVSGGGHFRRGFRFFYGVVLLAAGMFFWGLLSFVIADKLIGITWVNSLVTLILLIFTSPILTAFSMPDHGQP